MKKRNAIWKRVMAVVLALAMVGIPSADSLAATTYTVNLTATDPVTINGVAVPTISDTTNHKETVFGAPGDVLTISAASWNDALSNSTPVYKDLGSGSLTLNSTTNGVLILPQDPSYCRMGMTFLLHRVYMLGKQ